MRSFRIKVLVDEHTPVICAEDEGLVVSEEQAREKIPHKLQEGLGFDRKCMCTLEPVEEPKITVRRPVGRGHPLHGKDIGTDMKAAAAGVRKVIEGEPESVEHPSHYGGEANPYEAIKVIEAWELNFNTGNAVKYVSRAGKKDPRKTIEDLRKARWYLDREIVNLEKSK